MGDMPRVAVSHQLLRWARERSGQTPEDLAAAFPKLAEWEAGEIKPTLRQLEKYAQRTYTPFGYFFLDTPPEDRLPIPSFRTADDAAPFRPSPDLLATVFDMLRRQDWMREHRIAEGQNPLPFIGSARLGETPPLKWPPRYELNSSLTMVGQKNSPPGKPPYHTCAPPPNCRECW